MKSKGIIQLWGEFIDLSYGGKPRIDYRDLKDLELYPKVFLRKWKGEWTIHYLPIGTVLNIPAPWPSIWYEFVEWLSGREYTTDVLSSTVVERFAENMINVTLQIHRSLSVNYKYEDFEAWMDELVRIGTKPWRQIFLELWNIKLPSWTILDINGRKEI